MVDDRIDATLIASMLSATAAWEAATGRRMPRKPLREAVWFVWQQPRLPQPLVRSKYPMTVPWTAAARAAYLDNPNCDLVIEHVEPIHVLLDRLLTVANDPDAVAGELRAADRYC